MKQYYDRRTVTAPKWMEDFHCIAGDCPETCCQQWNIDVDPPHAESFMDLKDPELQPVMDRLLRKIQVRRPGKRSGETQYRLQLLNYPKNRCPILNENGECRLQKKYGAYILCDTCYFHPRTFFQIDDQTFLSACLSCPECARLALLHKEKPVFSQFEAEIDPNAEWIETSLMNDPDAQLLMQNRDQIIFTLCDLFSRSGLSLAARLEKAVAFLDKLAEFSHPDAGSISAAAALAAKADILPFSLKGAMRFYSDIFDPISETVQRSVQGAAELSRALAGGREGYASLLTKNFESGLEIAQPFLRENDHLLTNFIVHCVFSDSFREFYRYQNEPVSVRDIVRHETALLRSWYIFIHVQLALAALINQNMNEEIFLQTIMHADRTYWHYPEWFAHCAERLSKRF